MNWNRKQHTHLYTHKLTVQGTQVIVFIFTGISENRNRKNSNLLQTLNYIPDISK